MSRHTHHKKRHGTKRRGTKRHGTKRHSTKRHGRKTLKQRGGGFISQLIPSDIKLIGYFFENTAKLWYNKILGMP